ncbi:hypothetical protein ACFFR3_38870 [Nonomuraea salmonea]|uniref:HTH cro/C1-type domain-containing protein n=1 Tax=Nonomuraea salmonea TaxID=46181 RepID=A0ABV5NYU4_9ACTN
MSKSSSGVRRFTSLDLARIADLCGVSVDWLPGVAQPTPATSARTAGARVTPSGATGHRRQPSENRPLHLMRAVAGARVCRRIRRSCDRRA